MNRSFNVSLSPGLLHKSGSSDPQHNSMLLSSAKLDEPVETSNLKAGDADLANETQEWNIKQLDELLLDRNEELIGKTNWSVVVEDKTELSYEKPKKGLKKTTKEF